MMIDFEKLKKEVAGHCHKIMTESMSRDIVEVCERAIAAESELETLRAKLAEIEAQKPIGAICGGEYFSNSELTNRLINGEKKFLAVAESVREALDKKACPDAFMVIAYEKIVELLSTPTPPSAESGVVIKNIPMFQAASSGLWYEDPMACGEVSAVTFDAKHYKLPQVEQPDSSPSAEQKDRWRETIPVEAGVLNMIEITLLNAFVYLRDSGSDQKALMDGLSNWHKFMSDTLTVWESDTTVEQSDSAAPNEILSLGMDQPWSMYHSVEKLIEAAGILLDRKRFDGHGHELIREAQQQAAKYLKSFQPYNKPARITEHREPDYKAQVETLVQALKDIEHYLKNGYPVMQIISEAITKYGE